MYNYDAVHEEHDEGDDWEEDVTIYFASNQVEV